MSAFPALVLSSVICIACTLPAAAAVTDVRTENGWISGTTQPSGVTSFKGVPFAAPPIGRLRWHAPDAAANWTGIRQTRQFGPACIQAPEKPDSFYAREFGQTTEVSEDCLTLNIWTPPHRNTARLPVLVWFYGGAWIGGAASKPVYDGARLAQSGMVVITTNYRVGAFGFLAHPALSAESPEGISGNYGLLDQVAALRWVHANIARFGGDPAQVTIAGQSAGGLSVDFVMSMPSARGLFARAIVESGANVGAGPAYASLHTAETVGAAYLLNRGARTAAEMRALPAATILDSLPNDRIRSAACQTCSLNFAPVIDGKSVPAAPSVTFDHHLEAPVPLLIGTTEDETSPFTPPNVTPQSYETWATARWGAQSAGLMQLYPHATAQDAWRAEIKGAADNGLAGSRLQAMLHTVTGAHAFLYRFVHAPPGRDSDRYGAFHASELTYVFGTQETVDRPWTSDDRALSRTIMQYWANFVRRGDPNGPGLPTWPSLTSATDTMMCLDTDPKAARVPAPVTSALFAQQLHHLIELQQQSENETP